MASVMITFNPDLEGDIEEARSILDRLSKSRAETSADPEVLREKIIAHGVHPAGGAGLARPRGIR